MKIWRRLIYIALSLTSGTFLHAQNYSAINGSNYAGGLGVYNNPSSVLMSPYQWDLTLFGTQFSAITNGLRGQNFPLYLSPASKFDVADGNFARNADLSTNLRLLNGSILLNKQNALAFGVNLRTYTEANSSTFNYNDSVKGVRTFLFYNEDNRSVSASVTSSAWMELYGSYSRTLWDQEGSRLNAGLTVKMLRSMSGAYARVNDIGIERGANDSLLVNNIVQGSAQYGYSANHGDLSSFNAADIFSGSLTSVGFDIGVEYLVKSQAVPTVYDEHTHYDYDWKVGISILDLGLNRFIYGSESRSVSSLKEDISGEVLHDKFTSIDNVAQLNDSLSTIVESMQTLRGNFDINTPARVVLNVDRYMWGNFYLNGELSFNLTSNKKDKLTAREYRMLTVTPRWEKKKFGFAFPVQVTRMGNVWIGGALRAGPLLLGTHNLLNVFSGNSRLAGGAYLAITLRPRDFLREPRNRQYECPAY